MTRDAAPDAAPGAAPSAGSTLVVSSDLAALEREFVAAVRAAKGNDPVAPVLVVAGSHLQHVYLRRRLARALRAAANVRFVTLMDLAGELALPGGAAEAAGGRAAPPLPDGAHVPLLEQVIAEQRAPGRGHPGHRLAEASMVHAVAATLRDLREGGIAAPLVAAAAPRPWLRALAAIAAAYRQALAPFSDATATVEQAAAAAPAQTAAILQRCAPGARQVLIYGIYDVNALQLRMLARLVRAMPARMFLPWNAGAEQFAFAHQTVERLRQCGLRLVSLDAGPAARPAARPPRGVFLRRPPGGDRGDGAPRARRPGSGRAGGRNCHPAPHGPGLRRTDLRRAGPGRGAPLPLHRQAGAALSHRTGRPQPAAVALC